MGAVRARLQQCASTMNWITNNAPIARTVARIHTIEMTAAGLRKLIAAGGLTNEAEAYSEALKMERKAAQLRACIGVFS